MTCEHCIKASLKPWTGFDSAKCRGCLARAWSRLINPCPKKIASVGLSRAEVIRASINDRAAR